MGAEAIYDEKGLSFLTTILRLTQASNIIDNPNAVALFNFHNTLLSIAKLSKEVLLNSILNSELQNSIDNGLIVFQILIDGEGLETEKYIKIFSALQELIETISKVVNETDQKSEIVLLDSGSDTNIGIKSGIETAKSLFLIFKEIWDYITSFRHYKQAQKNKSLIDSLTLRAEILKKVEEGVITENEALEYTHIIKTRTDDLIGMKVLPKEIAIQTNQIENTKLLSEFEGFKLLTSGE